ncbi:uncharacterized protein LOC115228110 [Octopus sinensis]|uniref:Uncharacterized protein LOC115228110 n=1 Tax=Octopus sinensis TaxID=2607531 RepID=A0A6P7TQW0_9MOLL|nr:uncharacterized protein LOC115228110 [Octopus sinensis]
MVSDYDLQRKLRKMKTYLKQYSRILESSGLKEAKRSFKESKGIIDALRESIVSNLSNIEAICPELDNSCDNKSANLELLLIYLHNEIKALNQNIKSQKRKEQLEELNKLSKQREEMTEETEKLVMQAEKASEMSLRKEEMRLKDDLNKINTEKLRRAETEVRSLKDSERDVLLSQQRLELSRQLLSKTGLMLWRGERSSICR